jgi:hypothetical protein
LVDPTGFSIKPAFYPFRQFHRTARFFQVG